MKSCIKSVAEELSVEATLDMRAAVNPARTSPLRPGGKNASTSLG